MNPVNIILVHIISCTQAEKPMIENECGINNIKQNNLPFFILPSLLLMFRLSQLAVKSWNENALHFWIYW